MELGASRTVAVEAAALAQSVVIVARQVQRVTVDLVRRQASLALIRSALTLPVPTLSRVVVVAAQVARTRRRRQVGGAGSNAGAGTNGAANKGGGGGGSGSTASNGGSGFVIVRVAV